MKALFALVVVSSIYVTPALATGEAPAVKAPPTETIEVLPEASTGLFERVREAHIRAIHKGVLAAKTT